MSVSHAVAIGGCEYTYERRYCLLLIQYTLESCDCLLRMH